MNSSSLTTAVLPNSNQMPAHDSPGTSGVHVDSDAAQENLQGHALRNRFRKSSWTFHLETHHFALYENMENEVFCNLPAIVRLIEKTQTMSAHQTLSPRQQGHFSHFKS